MFVTSLRWVYLTFLFVIKMSFFNIIIYRIVGKCTGVAIGWSSARGDGSQFSIGRGDGGWYGVGVRGGGWSSFGVRDGF